MEKEKMDTAQVEKNNKNKDIRRFVLFGYDELKNEATSRKTGEYTKALVYLTERPTDELFKEINKAKNQVALAHSLTNIE